MYDFIYYVIYMQQIKKGKSSGFARYNGCLIVGLTLIIHLMFLYSSMKTIFLNWFKAHLDKVHMGISNLFVFSILGLAFYHYNSKTTEKILKKYSLDLDPTRMINYLKVIGIMFIPLIFGIILAKRY